MSTVVEVANIDQYSTGVLQQLHVLQTEEILCDVRLTSQRGGVSAHRIVLMAACPYLKSRLSKEFSAERGKDVVNFAQTPLVLIERVVKYMYTGKLELCGEHVQELMLFCADLELKEAKEACEKYKKEIEEGKEKETTAPNLIIVKQEQNDEDENSLNLTTTDVTKADKESPSKKRRVLMAPVKRRRAKTIEDTNIGSVVEDGVPLKKKRGRPPLETNDSERKYVPLKQRRKTAENKTYTELDDDDINVDMEDASPDTNTPKQTVPSEHDPIDEACAKQIRDALKDLGRLTGIDETAVESSETFDDTKPTSKGDTDPDYTETTDEEAVYPNDEETKSVSKPTKSKVKPKTVPKLKIKKPALKTTGKRGRKKADKSKDPEDPKEPRKRSYIKVRKTKKFPCTTCTRVLSSQKRRMFHEYTKHGAPFDTATYNCFPCDKEGCEYVAGNRHNLSMHMKSRHSVDRPHICEFCGKGFKLPNVLATHINIHTGKKKWKCETCGELFNQQSGLDIHHKRHHIGEASWHELCHLCSEKFLQKSELVWHLFKYHDIPLPTKYKAHVCDICNYLTKSVQDLRRHMNAHRGIKPFLCPICQKSCATKSELKRHVGFHGEKSFKCTYEGCSFACTDSIGLVKHVRLMHTHKHVKPFACPVCPYRTGVKGNVDKHIRSVHNLDVVTKHTVPLKMKYHNFSSGDVVTKSGELVATVKERKELERFSLEDAQSGNSKINSSPMKYQEIPPKNESETSLSVKTLTMEEAQNNLSISNEVKNPPNETGSNAISVTQSHSNFEAQSTNANEVGGVGVRYLATLSNYVTEQTGLKVPVAQDLRMSIENQSTAVSQAEIYSMEPTSAMFDNKYDTQYTE